MKHQIQVQSYISPCGPLILGSLGDSLCLCDWATPERGGVIRRVLRSLDAELAEGPSEVTKEAARQLDEYFAGHRRKFDIPLLTVGTDFQQRVWLRLQEIPYGITLSYGSLADSLDCPRAVRAVASACGANAMSIFIPCHRVIAASGSLAGYAGSLQAKEFLLRLETMQL